MKCRHFWKDYYEDDNLWPAKFCNKCGAAKVFNHLTNNVHYFNEGEIDPYYVRKMTDKEKDTIKRFI